MRFIKSNCNNFDDEFACLVAKKFGILKVVADIVCAKGFSNIDEVESFLYPHKKRFENPFNLKNMEKVVQRINEAKIKNEKVLIFGDYDVDGIGATAILFSALKDVGINSFYSLPSRYIDGYGLTNEMLIKIQNEFNPDLIITVDCGISSFKEVEFAKTLNIEVIVTDHHEMPEILPDCLIVSSKLPDQKFMFKELCGAGVAYKVAEALLGSAKAEKYLPIAAISTVADMVPLIHENRLIVHFGLRLFEKQLPKGLKVFFDTMKIDVKSTQANDISFKIAPKLNSSGRMGFAEDSLELFFENDNVKILKIIDKINAHNMARVELCNKIYYDCKEILAETKIENSIILSSPEWDQGVLGIICARLVDDYSKPVILFSEVDGILKGSGRSIEGVNIHAMLSNFNGILEKFGGHAMAAGLTIKKQNFENFKIECDKYLSSLDKCVIEKIDHYDGEINVNEINFKLIQDIYKLEPFGFGNQIPVFKIKSGKTTITPLKNFPEHANVNFGNIFEGIIFDAKKCYDKLYVSGEKDFLVEIQKPKFKTKLSRGQIKNFKINSIENNSLFSVCENNFPFQFQFASNVFCENKFEERIDGTVINRLADIDIKKSTVLICTTVSDFKNIVSTYKNFEIEVGEISHNRIENTILLAPHNLKNVKAFENIVFVNFIKQPVVNFKHFIIKTNNTANIQLYKKLNYCRNELGKIFQILKEFNNKTYLSILKFVEAISLKSKTPCNNIYLAILIFLELNLIEFKDFENKLTLNLVNIKTSLENSEIIKYLREVKF